MKKLALSIAVLIIIPLHLATLTILHYANCLTGKSNKNNNNTNPKPPPSIGSSDTAES